MDRPAPLRAGPGGGCARWRGGEGAVWPRARGEGARRWRSVGGAGGGRAGDKGGGPAETPTPHLLRGLESPSKRQAALAPLRSLSENAGREEGGWWLEGKELARPRPDRPPRGNGRAARVAAGERERGGEGAGSPCGRALGAAGPPLERQARRRAHAASLLLSVASGLRPLAGPQGQGPFPGEAPRPCPRAPGRPATGRGWTPPSQRTRPLRPARGQSLWAELGPSRAARS